MKKAFILITLLLCFVFNGFSQQETKIGLNVGFNSFNEWNFTKNNRQKLLSLGLTFDDFMIDLSYGADKELLIILIMVLVIKPILKK